MKWNNTTAELEVMVDNSSLLHVLTGLELVCAEKAAFYSLGEDKHAVKVWDKAAKRLSAMAQKTEI